MTRRDLIPFAWALIALLLGIAAAVLVPRQADAAFERVYANPHELEVGMPTSVDILFDTNDTVLGLGAGVYGFGSDGSHLYRFGPLAPQVFPVGSLEILGMTGPLLDPLSNCQNVGCYLLDDGRIAGDGIEGIGIPVATFDVLAHTSGDGLRLRMAFTDGGAFSGPTPTVDTIIASAPLPYQSQPVPEPNSALLFLTGLAAVAWRMR